MKYELIKNVSQGTNGDDEISVDENKQGLLRTVPHAHLVFKRQQIDGTYEELWIYNVSEDRKRNKNIYDNILSGTDIEIDTRTSADGEQNVETWSVGNVEFVNISGLPN